MKLIIKKGDKFNKLTAIKFCHKDKHGCQCWFFKCDCGKEKVIVVNNVKNGHTKSCGCWKHGMTNTKTYYSWVSMKTRCFNKSDEHYKNYGARGITVCNEWLGKNGFQNFYKDMGERPRKKTLDRIDNDGNYELSNCRWATSKEQGNNQRSNHLVTYKGITKNVTQWAEILGIKRKTLFERARRGNDLFSVHEYEQRKALNN